MNHFEKNNEYLFEISWEVCNKVGGIHTVITSKMSQILKHFKKENYYLMGPYEENSKYEFHESNETNPKFLPFIKDLESLGIKLHFGKWMMDGCPNVILIEYLGYSNNINSIKGKLWENFQIDSLNSNWYDYDQAVLFSYVAGIIIEKLTTNIEETIFIHSHEWMAGGAIFYIKQQNNPKFKTIFTTHATMLGRAISSTNENIYEMIKDGFDVNKKSYDIGVHTKHQTEKALANHSDIFTTVSQITANEAEYFYEKKPDVLLLNGYNTNKIDGTENSIFKFSKSRDYIESFLKKYIQNYYPIDFENTSLFYTSGRNEFHNKGVDLYIDSLSKLNQELKLKSSNKTIINFFLIPIGTFELDKSIFEPKNKNEKFNFLPFSTHKISNDETIIQKFLTSNLLNRAEDNVKVILIPQYIDSNLKILNMNYYDFISGCDLGIFPSFYEPWGYTPLESITNSIPTITTDLSGFGRYIKDKDLMEQGVHVLTRENLSYMETVDKLFFQLKEFLNKSAKEKYIEKIKSRNLSFHFDWENFIANYIQAYSKAKEKN